MSRSNRVLNIVTGFFSSLFIQRKYDRELVGDSEVTKFKKKSFAASCRKWFSQFLADGAFCYFY